MAISPPRTLQNGSVSYYEEPAQRAAKRVKFEEPVSTDAAEAEESDNFVARHALGVRPAGNAYTAESDAKTASGYFASLPDELLVIFLETLSAQDLLRLGGTCRALFAFTRSEELWRTLFVETSPKDFTWRGSWRSTYLDQSIQSEPSVDCSNVYSDVLHRPFFCANVPLHAYAENIPPSNAIARLPDLTYEDFANDWANRPFILTEPVKAWPIYREWTLSRLKERYAHVAFRAESVDWPLETYLTYMQNSRDESPLYLFDRSFVEKMGLHVGSGSSDPARSAEEDGQHRAAYVPPACFGPDAFSVLDDQRPDHRWLIVGPARSGSTFHQDPNATSAWNAVVRGRKYWIMFPPTSSTFAAPPGVYVSADRSEVTAPLSIAEWLLGFHAEARQTPGCVEGICEEGEVLYVPSGWYHLVLNLEPSIAVTQNLVPRKRLGAVLRFLRDQTGSISGFSKEVEDPFSLFVARLRESDPELLAEGLAEMERLSKKGGRWEELTKGDKGDGEDGTGGGGFSFGFGGGEDDSDD